jgi:hypothetical protein
LKKPGKQTRSRRTSNPSSSDYMTVSEVMKLQAVKKTQGWHRTTPVTDRLNEHQSDVDGKGT